MIFLLIISSLLTVAVAQQSSLTCNYRIFGGAYICELTINNPNGLNNFTEIGGIHLEGFTNADIREVVRYSGVSTNVPSIICDTFPNATWFDFYNTGLTEIDDSSFNGCSNISRLYLDFNRIGSISANAFVNLPDILTLGINYNSITTLPENVFAGQRNLAQLYIGNNPFEDIPVGLFRPLENLQILEFARANVTAINNQWFSSNARLAILFLSGNRITLSPNNFVDLDSLVTLYLDNNGINQIPAGTFAGLPNLHNLYLYSNNFTELQADSFPGLGNLNLLDFARNPISEIHDEAFRGLGNLTLLDLSFCGITQLNSNTFENLGNLGSIYLNFNEIEELPQGLFAQLPNINYVGLWNNRLKTLSRSSFGALTNVQTIDLDGNVVNALDRAIIDDAVNLNTLYFDRNLCASNFFGNFQSNKAQYLVMLQRCFLNFIYVVETITDGGDEFSFFEGPNPGIALRVNTDNEAEVQIALTPFNFVWSPMIEIFIGTTNNTRSVIRINQETDVVTVPTPNIIIRDQWNDFRVTWGNQVILVFSGNNTLPFMGFTMQDFFPVNFYGLKAVGTTAAWSVQPFIL